MKKNDDLRFIKEKLSGEQTPLPEGLSADGISSLIESEAQEKPKIRRLVPVLASAAAVIVIAVGVLYGTGALQKLPDKTVPNTTVDVETVQKTASDYSELAKLLSDIKNSGLYAEYSGGGFYYDYDSSYAQNGSIVKTAEEAVTDAPRAESYASDPGNSASSESDGDYSQLNTRTQGVDEEDIMKTDGEYIYVLKSASNGWYYRCSWNGGSDMSFKIYNRDLSEAGEITLFSADTDDAVMQTRSYNGFFLYKSYVVFTGSETTYEGGGLKYYEDGGYWDFVDPENVSVSSKALISVYDISDKSEIKFVKDLWFSGSMLSSRITDGKLIAVSSYYPDYSVFNAEDYTTFIPAAGEKDAYLDADSITVLDNEESNYTTVSIVSLDDGSFTTNSASVLGQAWDIYCTGQNVYTYGEKTRYYGSGGWTSVLNINKIDVSGPTPEYVASADIENASLNDSFSIDEYNGYLRLAVDMYSQSSGKDFCRVLVLGKNMKTVGKTESFAQNEYIRSARFMGNTAYVVTFRNTDPLFVIDLSDPEDPVIKGELSLPGFSAYLHPVGESLLEGIGYDGTENGLNGGAKISVFDVSDPEDPKEADSYAISSAWLNAQYKDFVRKGENGYIVNYFDSYKNASGALYFTVTDGKITVESTVSAGEFSEILKTLFIENTVYFYTYGYNTEGYSLSAYDLLSGEKLAGAALD